MVQKSRVRWLAAEVIVVVLGVLIALAADGWREDVQRFEEERLYLDLLSEDVNATLRALQRAQATLETMKGATLTLIGVHESGDGGLRLPRFGGHLIS